MGVVVVGNHCHMCLVWDLALLQDVFLEPGGSCPEANHLVDSGGFVKPTGIPKSRKRSSSLLNRPYSPLSPCTTDRALLKQIESPLVRGWDSQRSPASYRWPERCTSVSFPSPGPHESLLPDCPFTAHTIH